MLKRHLATRYNMTPDDYRQRWGLAKDYPMVAPAYAAQRSTLALQIGLGRKPAAAASEPSSPRDPAPSRRGSPEVGLSRRQDGAWGPTWSFPVSIVGGARA